ncbi:MAG: hypothetical protein M3Z09_14585 [Acidobacteriota bacterium]|nr:hypothetical protein [Acidobacteriota bacterium]
MTIANVGDLSPAPPEPAKNGKSAGAAHQFETLLIAQMLKTMREGGSGWLGTGEDQAGEAAIGMAEEHFAAALSAGGGFGLSQMVEHGLKDRQKLQE